MARSCRCTSSRAGSVQVCLPNVVPMCSLPLSWYLWTHVGKVESWAACKDDAIKRDGFLQRRQAFVKALPAEETARLTALSSEPRDDANGEAPGSEKNDEEERLFLASLSDDDRAFLDSHKGLGNSQKAEVAWLEAMGYDYEEVDVRDFRL